MRPCAIRMAGFTLLPVILAMSLIAAIAFLLNRDNGMNAEMATSQGDADRARYVAEAGLQAVNAITQGRNCIGYPDDSSPTTAAFGGGSFTATVNATSGSPVTLTATATTAGGASASLTRANVVVHQTTPQTITLQPGTTGMDTYIRSSSPSGNYGADTSLKSVPGQSVALVQFDLSYIPADSTILSAQFSLYHTTGGTNTVSAFGVTKPWTEGTGAAGSGATWNTYNGVNSWATAGGDYDAATGVAIVLPGNNAWATWDLTSQMAAWTAGTQPNYGIALVATTGSNDAFVSSDEMSSTTLRPKLTVNFLPPCGWVPPATGVTLLAIKDTWIDKTGNGGANYGGSISFTVTDNAGRGLVQFDLSSIPAGTVLTSAKLQLYVQSFNNPLNSTLTVNKVYDPWVEGTRNGSGSADGATWKTRDGSNNWSAGFGIYWGFGGGDPISETALSSSFTSGWVEWDVTALAQIWVANPSLNRGAGVLINTTSAITFQSRTTTANPPYPPQLVISY